VRARLKARAGLGVNASGDLINVSSIKDTHCSFRQRGVAEIAQQPFAVRKRPRYLLELPVPVDEPLEPVEEFAELPLEGELPVDPLAPLDMPDEAPPDEPVEPPLAEPVEPMPEVLPRVLLASEDVLPGDRSPLQPLAASTAAAISA